MAHSFARLYYHFVFSTAERRDLIDAELEPRLHAYLGGILRDLDGVALAVGGIENHVHILASLRAKTAPADAVGVVKSHSSGWVHREFPKRSSFAWQTGYAVFGVSHSNLDTVKDYIARQREHHATLTFERELISLLTKHDIEYDERFVFD